MKRKENGVQLPFVDDAFIAEWQIWLAYRRERNLATYKPIGLKRTFANLIEISGNNPQVAIQIINQSICNNWQGLFKLKNNGKINTGTSGKQPVHQFIGQGDIGQL